ncbi:MAG: hypothetical protein JSV58_02980 [Candidatus Bathyarchaeota archaeon]|nr:MAG: hypothetical protein JSV58_02980 [Candidatus Bathyarchaeota archaeon]
MAAMKCMFDLEKECPVYNVLKEIVDRPDPYKILEHACPYCQNRPFPERPFPERPFPRRPERPER